MELQLGIYEIFWGLAIILLLIALILYCVKRRFTRQARQLKTSEQFYQSLYLNNPDLIITFDKQGHFLSMNHVVETYGFTEEELLHRSFAPYIVPEELDKTLGNFLKAVNGTAVNYETAFFNKFGHRVETNVTDIPIIVDGEIVGVYGIHKDITEQKKAEAKIQYMAYHDALTGLPNRYYFSACFPSALSRANMKEAAILFLDLDRFKLVNDTLGHDSGDLLLKEVSERLAACIQSEDCLARMGGDEFILFLPGALPEKAAKVAKEMLARLNKPFILNDYEMYITPSIGISRYPQDGEDLEGLIKKADLAMQQAKYLGKNNFQFYENKSVKMNNGRFEMEKDLRKAIERDEFALYYQPKIDIRTGEMTGVEALIRWQHPEKGLISPGQFISLAEETGMIIAMGEWVLKKACSEIKSLQDEGFPPIVIAVNLSLRQFFQQNFIQMVQEIIVETGLPSECLELEITESMMIDTHHALCIVCELKKLGVKISLDDFGTGYSSLHYLKKFPIDKIKIDQSFIRECLTESSDAAIVKTIIAMAHQLGMTAIAEGVETEEQLVFLQQSLCDVAQGYLFSKPVPIEELKSFIVKSDRMICGNAMQSKIFLVNRQRR